MSSDRLFLLAPASSIHTYTHTRVGVYAFPYATDASLKKYYRSIVDILKILVIFYKEFNWVRIKKNKNQRNPNLFNIYEVEHVLCTVNSSHTSTSLSSSSWVAIAPGETKWHYNNEITMDIWKKRFKKRWNAFNQNRRKLMFHFNIL